MKTYDNGPLRRDSGVWEVLLPALAAGVAIWGVSDALTPAHPDTAKQVAIANAIKDTVSRQYPDVIQVVYASDSDTFSFKTQHDGQTERCTGDYAVEAASDTHATVTVSDISCKP